MPTFVNKNRRGDFVCWGYETALQNPHLALVPEDYKLLLFFPCPNLLSLLVLLIPFWALIVLSQFQDLWALKCWSLEVWDWWDWSRRGSGWVTAPSPGTRLCLVSTVVYSNGNSSFISPRSVLSLCCLLKLDDLIKWSETHLWTCVHTGPSTAFTKGISSSSPWLSGLILINLNLVQKRLYCVAHPKYKQAFTSLGENVKGADIPKESAQWSALVAFLIRLISHSESQCYGGYPKK